MDGIYATFWDEYGVDPARVHVLVDEVDYTQYAYITPCELWLAYDEEIMPTLGAPRDVKIVVGDVFGNTQTVEESAHIFDPSGGPNPEDDPLPTTSTASYRLYKSGNVRIRVYNMDEDVIYRETQESQSVGNHTFEWDGLDDQAQPCPDGTYRIAVCYTGQQDEPIAAIDPKLGGGRLWLGQSNAITTSGKRNYPLYTPTGGTLKLHFSAPAGHTMFFRSENGYNEKSLTSVGQPVTLTRTVNDGGHYWQVRILPGTSSGNYTIWAEFTQEGQADHRPWNSWYWPYNHMTPGPHMYDLVPDTNQVYAPLQKYETVYPPRSSSESDSVLAWESKYRNNGHPGWAGYCDGWVVASIFHPVEPTSGNARGVYFCADEKKALLLKLYECFEPTMLNKAIYHWPTVADCDNTPLYASTDTDANNEQDNASQKIHNLLYMALHCAHECLQANLTWARQVWNYPVYSYEASFNNVIDKPMNDCPWQYVEVTSTILAADDMDGMDSTKMPQPGDTQSYDLVYRVWLYDVPAYDKGIVIPAAVHPDEPHNTWVSSTIRHNGVPATGFVPRWIVWPKSVSFDEQNRTAEGKANMMIKPAWVRSITEP